MVKFGRQELSIPPLEISRRDLQVGHDFSICWARYQQLCIFRLFIFDCCAFCNLDRKFGIGGTRTIGTSFRNRTVGTRTELIRNSTKPNCEPLAKFFCRHSNQYGVLLETLACQLRQPTSPHSGFRNWCHGGKILAQFVYLCVSLVAPPSAN